MLTDKEKRKCALILEKRRNNQSHHNPWSYEEGEIPQALKDEIGTAIVEYVSEQDAKYISSPQISKELEYDSTPKKIGWRMRLMGRTLDMDDKETYGFYSNNCTWDLEAFKQNGFDELYREVTNRND